MINTYIKSLINYGAERGLIPEADKIYTTNLIYQPQELLDRPWHHSCDMGKFIAYIIDTLNHDSSISDLLIPSERIWSIVAQYKEEKQGGKDEESEESEENQ